MCLGKAHELRNEVVEELTPDLMGESGIVLGFVRLKLSRNSERCIETSSRRAGKPGKETIRCFSEQQTCPRSGNTQITDRDIYAVAKPSQVAKLAGTPNSLIVTRPAVGVQTLRASRSAHERQ